MPTYALILEYDGSPFCGWQLQKGQEGPTSVQGALERALETFLRHPVRVRAASRTDAGVHARGQVVAFDTARTGLPPIAFERGLLPLLPPEVVVRSARVAEDAWDPRRTTRGKHYRYVYWNDRSPSALERRRAWLVPAPLDLARMQEAADLLVGTHDFESFRSAGCEARHAVRTLYRMEVSRGEYRRVYLDVVGNAFVRNMVRIIAGNLMEVGRGKRSPAALREVLLARDRTRAGVTAPPWGLYLEEVIYDDRLPPRPSDGQDLEGGA